jgi:hypothetical protein
MAVKSLTTLEQTITPGAILIKTFYSSPDSNTLAYKKISNYGCKQICKLAKINDENVGNIAR